MVFGPSGRKSAPVCDGEVRDILGRELRHDSEELTLEHDGDCSAASGVLRTMEGST